MTEAPPLIHVGFHKTGTTLLQQCLFKPEGGFFPVWTVASGEAIEYFVLAHPKRFQAEAMRHRYCEAVRHRPAGTLPVISHEDLCGHPVRGRYYGFEVAQRLAAAFPDGRVLVCFREQRSMLRSLWGQYVLQDGEWPLEVFLGSEDAPHGFQSLCRLDHLEYDLLIGQYRELFGADRVLALPYEMLKLDSVGFQQRILDFAEVETGTIGRVPIVHSGHGGGSIELMRVLNRFVKRSPDWNGQADRLSIPFRAKEYLGARVDRIMWRRIDERVERRITEIIRRRTEGYYCRSNAALAQMLGLDLQEYGYMVDRDDCHKGTSESCHKEASRNSRTP